MKNQIEKMLKLTDEQVIKGFAFEFLGGDISDRMINKAKNDGRSIENKRAAIIEVALKDENEYSEIMKAAQSLWQGLKLPKNQGGKDENIQIGRY